MATEMGVEDALSLKIFELREAILNNKNFDEDFCIEQINIIIDERKRKEEMKMAKRKRLDELEERKRKDEMDVELQKKRIELQGGGTQSNAVQAEDATKNIVTAKIDAPESTWDFLVENIDKLKVIKVKCLDVILDGTVDFGVQISVVRADLVKDIESTGERKIKLISAFGDSEVAPLRTFNIKIDDGWNNAIPITCAVLKKLMNDM
ncbi:retrovirus-related Pol polyprotein from transposon opus [Trichonephila clavata]|uniref:Retrovirus-related Pol polyprotein from transposon opus n=1 Tax=Trichonephila clavata TaxID=2740835 RepID=A0A8X6G1K8_TRICU|nr:retrovirus-related Pol polyprotein from transposon opus [Trichonephila clavata]